MLQYKVGNRKATIGPRKGQTVYFAKPLPQVKVATEIVEQRIVNMTSLSVGDVRSAVTSLAQVLREELYSGRAVDLADLGTFKVVSNSRLVGAEKEVTVANLHKPRIQFFPKKEMRTEAQRVGREILRDGFPKAPVASSSITPPVVHTAEEEHTSSREN